MPFASRDRWYVLAVMTVVYALNIADRFSISTLLEPIRKELQLSDSGIGFLTGVALALFYVTVGIPVAILADRSNRRNILAIAIAIWSAMTVLCGLAQNYWQLLLGRFGVGIGEAGGTPPATSILADKFPASRRPMALTIFALGACLGAWLGSSLAGQVAERYGWRAAFLVLGGPGLLVAAIVWLTVREPQRGQLDAGSVVLQPTTLSATVRFIRTQRSAFHLLMGISVATFWSWGLMWWTPTFLQRSHHMTVGEAGQLLGPMHLLAGTAGTLMAGWLVGPKSGGRSPLRYEIAGLGDGADDDSLDSAVLGDIQAGRDRAAVDLRPRRLFLHRSVLGLLQNVLPANMRATAIALALFTANVANLVVAPQLIGWLSDGFAVSFGAGQESLRWALLLLAPTGFWAAWHFRASGATIREDEVTPPSGRQPELPQLS